MSAPEVRALLPASMPAVLRLIAAEVPELRLGEDDLRRNLFEDPDAAGDLLLGAFEGDALVGVACAVVRSQTAHLKLLVVEPSRRRLGIGGHLQRETERRLAVRGAASVQTDGASPVYLLPGLPMRCDEARGFFERRGYREIDTRLSMTADLRAATLGTRDLEARLMRAGVHVRRAAADDADLLRPEITRLFSRDWAVEVDSSLRRASAGTHVALAEGRFAGFASAAVWARNTFGPMGTSPAFEGKGIGETLLKRCLADLQEAGEQRAVIPWVGPEEFYRRKVGAATTLKYVVMEKSLAHQELLRFKIGT